MSEQRMQNFLRPDARKVLTTGALIGAVLLCLTLRQIPVQVDILDLREVPEFVVFLFGRIPIELFDFATDGAFRPQGEGFLVFPSLPQVAFALLFDVAALYLASCAVCHRWRRPAE